MKDGFINLRKALNLAEKTRQVDVLTTAVEYIQNNSPNQSSRMNELLEKISTLEKSLAECQAHLGKRKAAPSESEVSAKRLRC